MLGIVVLGGLLAAPGSGGLVPICDARGRADGCPRDAKAGSGRRAGSGRSRSPDRFVAVLIAPGLLLTVWARHLSPDAIRARLAHRQYRDVYLDLQGSPTPKNSWFLQDMKADGRCSARDQAADVLYDQNGAATIFDGDGKNHGWSGKEYAQRLSAVDQRYSRLLEVLLRQLVQG